QGLVGGPAIAIEHEPAAPDFPYFDAFLRATCTPPLPLDFVSWHHYGGPSGDAGDAPRVRALLQNSGCDPRAVALINSEWHWATGLEGAVTAWSEARLAALLPARYYSMMEAGLAQSFLFAVNGSPEGFVTRWPDTPEDKVRPGYNVLRMMNALTGRR